MGWNIVICAEGTWKHCDVPEHAFSSLSRMLDILYSKFRAATSMICLGTGVLDRTLTGAGVGVRTGGGRNEGVDLEMVSEIRVLRSLGGYCLCLPLRATISPHAHTADVRVDIKAFLQVTNRPVIVPTSRRTHTFGCRIGPKAFKNQRWSTFVEESWWWR